MEINILKNKWIIPCILIFIVISTSIYFRTMTERLPITDKWAKSTVENYYQKQIFDSISKEYPNLPDSKKQEVALQEFEKIPKDKLGSDIKGLSQTYKNNFKYENGDTYLLEIDPYMWYHYTENYVNNGMSGDSVKNGMPFDSLRNGRMGREEGTRSHSWIMAQMYNIFGSLLGISLNHIVFLFPIIFMSLCAIPAFFVTKRFAGNIGGFIAGMIIVLNAPLLSRTIGGFSDTDTYNIILPLFMLWFLIEAFYTSKWSIRILYSLLAGGIVTFYAITWGGWFYIFDFTIVMMLIYTIYLFFKQKDKLKEHLIISGLFISITEVLLLIIRPSAAFRWIEGPLWVLVMKDVGVSTIWPNVLTTVAEFNTTQLSGMITSLGTLVFVVSLIGIVYTYFKDKRLFIILVLWYIGVLFAYTKGARFNILLVPALGIATGIAVGFLYEKLSEFIDKGLKTGATAAKITMVLLSISLLIQPFTAAQQISENELPLFNDAWYESLQDIKGNSTEGYITSWWDYGHWFYSQTGFHVTFDGGDQGKRIYWVGKSLLTNNETQSINILKMLNCKQEEAYNELLISGMTEKQAIDELTKRVDNGYKFCDNYIPQYFIVSNDMIGKSGVWAHFGSWDFDKAQLWQDVRNGKTEGIDEGTIFDILNTPGDKWISPWPSYSSRINCNSENEMLVCGQLVISLKNMTVNTDQIRYISYLNNSKFIQKEINPQGQISIILSNKGVFPCNNELAGSMFTRLFFFEGVGIESFKLISHKQSLTGDEIYTYKINMR